MNFEDAEAILKEYLERAEKYEMMRKELHDAASPEDRLQRFQERSKTTFEFYLKNQTELKQLLAWIRGELDGKPSDDEFEKLFEQADMLYRSPYCDLFLLQEIAKPLLLHFEEKHDLVRSIFLCLCLAYVNIEASRISQNGYGAVSMEYYRKLFAMASQVEQEKQVQIYKDLAVSYANILMVETSLCSISMDEAYRYWLDAKKLRSNPDFLAHMKEPKTEKSAALLDRFIKRFEVEAYDIYRNNHPQATPEMVAWMERKSEKEFKQVESSDKELLNCSSELMITHIEYLLDHKKIKPDEALAVLDAYVDRRAPLLTMQKDDVISFYSTYAAQILVLLPATSLSEEKQKRIRKKYTEIIESFIREYTYDSNHAYSLNNALWVLAFQPEFYRDIESPEEKIDLLYRFVVKRHLTTYLHSQMVAYFAEAIAERVLEKRPDLLIGFHGLQSVDEVLEQKETILRFVKNAALLHDVGKNSMISIIDMQIRPLFDPEFKLICTHPAKGAELLSLDADFCEFRDVAWGHHKFYNGKGGYPADFDNTASPIRIIIDLITLCDCMDAATDTLGRNYRRAKTVHQVAEEFIKDAGTRYNPDLAELIAWDEPLLDELEELTVNGREKLVKESALIGE